MIKNESTELTIFFADICRSTVLFDKLGDQTALEIVMAALELAEHICVQNHGSIIGTIGDEIMCTFPTPEDALIAASHLHSHIRNNALMQAHHLAMRVGINSGAVVPLGDTVYGDAVNVAARLAQQAKANQSLVSATTIAALSSDLQRRLRRVGQISLQGKAGMLEVHEWLEPDDAEEITEVTNNDEIIARSFLMSVRYLTRQMRFDPMLVRFLFGRSVDCDQVIDHPTISREHAEFTYRNGQFILRDFSTNGSHVVQGKRIRQLHRSSMELKGKGKIYLGRTLHQRQFCIEFTCAGGK